MRYTYPIPRNANDFENWACRFATEHFKSNVSDLYGSQGQAQSGVDVLVRLPNGEWVGVQCKRYYNKNLTKKILQADLDMAHSIEPKLARYFVATTKNRDTKLQDWARSATLHGQCEVDIWFWDKFEDWIDKDPGLKSEYLDLDVVTLAKSLVHRLDSSHTCNDVLAYVAGNVIPAICEADAVDSYIVISARAKLNANRPDLALGELRALLDSGNKEAAAWRVAAAAFLVQGNTNAVIEIVARATALGIMDAKLDVFHASALLKQKETTSAKTILAAALIRANAAERPMVLAAWLTYRLEVERASYNDLLAELNEEDLKAAEVHVPLTNAAAIQLDHSIFDHHINILKDAPNIDSCIVPLLQSSATIVAAENAKRSNALAFDSGALRDDVQRAAMTIRGELNEFRHTQHSSNRVVALVWLGRAYVLLNQYVEADRAFLDAVVASQCSPEAMHITIAYMDAHGRENAMDEFIEIPGVVDHPFTKLRQISRLANNDIQGARNALQLLIENLIDDTEWYPFALATLFDFPYDPQATNAAIEQVTTVLSTLSNPDAPICALAALLRDNRFEAVHQRIENILAVYSPKNLSAPALVRLTSLLRHIDAYELSYQYAVALDELVDQASNHYDKETVLLILADALNRLCLNRVESLIERFSATQLNDYDAYRFRAELAWRRGQLGECYEQTAKIIDAGFANIRDIQIMAFHAITAGRLHDAKRRLKFDRLPKIRTGSDFTIVANALLLVGRTRDREKLFREHHELAETASETLSATVTPLLLGRHLPSPRAAEPHTVIVLRREYPEPIEHCLWITPKPGASAPHITRVSADEIWLKPLIGCEEGDSVTFTQGRFIGHPWIVTKLLPGDSGIHALRMDWATRQGLAGGGVDVIHDQDNPVPAMEQYLQAATTRAPAPDELLLPIPFLAHQHERIPLDVMNRAQKLRCSTGEPTEWRIDRELLSHFPSSVIVDPLTVFLANQYGIADELWKAAGEPVIAPQTAITLAQWWWIERNWRKAPMVAGLSKDGRLKIEIHDIQFRKMARAFWQDLAKSVGPQLHILNSEFSDADGSSVNAMCRLMDMGTVATAAYALSLRRPVLSLDRNLVKFLQSINIPAVTVPGLLTSAVARGRLTPRESIGVKAALARNRWTFISVSVPEILGLLKADDDMRDVDFRAALQDFSISEPASALGVILGVLNETGKTDIQVTGKPISRALFDQLPNIPPQDRAATINRFRNARRAWYKDELKRWRYSLN